MSVGIAALAGAATLASVRVAGRGADEWWPVVCAFVANRMTRRHRLRAEIPTDGIRVSPTAQRGRMAPPKAAAALDGVGIIDIAHGERSLGASASAAGAA